jgi:hypothetical protein
MFYLSIYISIYLYLSISIYIYLYLYIYIYIDGLKSCYFSHWIPMFGGFLHQSGALDWIDTRPWRGHQTQSGHSNSPAAPAAVAVGWGSHDLDNSFEFLMTRDLLSIYASSMGKQNEKGSHTHTYYIYTHIHTLCVCIFIFIHYVCICIYMYVYWQNMTIW